MQYTLPLYHSVLYNRESMGDKVLTLHSFDPTSLIPGAAYSLAPPGIKTAQN